MATYRSEGFKFNRANLAGIDAETRHGINRFLNARERELNTFNTVCVQCNGGPLNGQQIETTGEGTLPLCMGQWVGHYDKVGKWHGTQGETRAAIDASAQATNEKRAGFEKELGKGFNALGQLLAELAEDPQERAQKMPKIHRANFEYFGVDDCGEAITTPLRAGLYSVAREAVRSTARGRIAYKYRETITAHSGQGNTFMDDFGTLRPFKPTAQRVDAQYTTMTDKAVYTIGRTRYTIDASEHAAQTLRAKILAKKRLFADKALNAPKVTACEDAAQRVREVIAQASAKAVIETARTKKTASKASKTAQDVRELATVGHASGEACSAVDNAGPAQAIHGATAQHFTTTPPPAFPNSGTTRHPARPHGENHAGGLDDTPRDLDALHDAQRAIENARQQSRGVANYTTPRETQENHAMQNTTPSAPQYITGAELQTLRESCGLSRETFGELANVAARTIKHWETRRGGVPADIAKLATELESAARQAIIAHTERAILMHAPRGKDTPVILTRYREGTTPDPATWGTTPASMQGAIVAGMRLALLAKGFAVRVVMHDADYTTPRETLEAQAVPHRADQPPTA